MLNHTKVGIVFIVEDHISIKLENTANMYSHQMLIPKINPGIIIIPFTKKARNSTVLGLSQ